MKPQFYSPAILSKSRKRGKAALPTPVPSQRLKERSRPGSKGLLFCRLCEAVFYKKLWRHGIAAVPTLPKNATLNHTLCPACKMAEEHLYEGEVILQNIPGAQFDEVIRLIRNAGKRSNSDDPMDRILSVDASRGKGTIRITTSENQLARRIGTMLEHAFGYPARNTLSREDYVIRVTIDFGEK